MYCYLLFTNDCESYEDFRFAAGMLEEYMSLNIRELKRQQELNHKRASQSKERKKSRSSGRYNPRHTYDQVNTLDHSKYDPMDEQFFQKNKIYNSYIKQAG